MVPAVWPDGKPLATLRSSKVGNLDLLNLIDVSGDKLFCRVQKSSSKEPFLRRSADKAGKLKVFRIVLY